jgi:hypothetical protein
MLLFPAGFHPRVIGFIVIFLTAVDSDVSGNHLDHHPTRDNLMSSSVPFVSLAAACNVAGELDPPLYPGLGMIGGPLCHPLPLSLSLVGRRAPLARFESVFARARARLGCRLGWIWPVGSFSSAGPSIFLF